MSRLDLPPLSTTEPRALLAGLEQWRVRLEQADRDLRVHWVPLHFLSTTAIAPGASTSGLDGSAGGAVEVPVGMELVVTSATAQIRTGATAGAYAVTCYVGDLRTPNLVLPVFVEHGIPASTIHRTSRAGSWEAPLLVVPQRSQVALGFLSGSTSPGNLNAGLHLFFVSAYFRKTA